MWCRGLCTCRHFNAGKKPESALHQGGSRYLSSKYQGELAVRAEFQHATILRSLLDVYGEDTSQPRGSAFRKNKKGGLSLYGKGEMTIKQLYTVGPWPPAT